MGNRLNRWKIVLASFCTLFCLAGCGESGSEVDPATNPAPDSEEEEAVIDRSDFDWRVSEWKRTNARGDGALYVGDYVEELQHEVDFDYEMRDHLSTRSYESLVCRLDYFTMENGESRYYMNRYNGDTGEITYTEMDIDSFLGEESVAEISCFDICSEEEYVFLRVVYEEGHDFSPGWNDEDDRVCGLAAVHTDLEGNILKIVDLYPGVARSEYLEDRGWGQWQSLSVDCQGNYYLNSSLSGDMSRKIAVLDCEGRMLCVVNPYPKGTKEAGQWGSEHFCYMTKTPDGTPIFCLAPPSQSETLLFVFDPQRNEMRQMSLPYFEPNYMKSCMTEDGMFYYLSAKDGNLYRWDLCTGGILKLMNCAAEDITTNIGYLILIMDSAGRLILSEFDDDEAVSCYILTEQKPFSEGNMRLVSLDSDCTELQASAADYTRKHRQNGISVEYNSEDLEAYRDRLMAELVAGKGPDAMYVTREDMETLYEKGLLEDLSDVLSPETAEQIFPGVLECGRIEGRQVGFALEAKLLTMLVSRDVWSGDSWSLKDVLVLLEKEEIRAELEAVVATGVPPFGASGIFRHLVMQDIAHSPFLDLENNTCSFDHEEFIRILELCKQYDRVSVGDEAVSLVQEGKALAYVGDFSTINSFCHRMSCFGEDFHCVGYPTESGCGSFWNCDYFLVVRKGTDCMNTVKGYVEYLYSVSRQRKQQTPLHREVYNRYIVQMSDPDYDYLYCGQGLYIPLQLKPDGSSGIEEFLKLAEESVPQFRSDDAIARIVMEEAESFFAGDKDAATVAGIIQNRVKMYLAEHS